MTDDDRVELIAQAIWMGQFGTTVLIPRYQAWAADNKQEADVMRSKARDLLNASKGQKHHSLGWLP